MSLAGGNSERQNSTEQLREQVPYSSRVITVASIALLVLQFTFPVGTICFANTRRKRDTQGQLL
jgi:hypothetical protein